MNQLISSCPLNNKIIWERFLIQIIAKKTSFLMVSPSMHGLLWFQNKPWEYNATSESKKPWKYHAKISAHQNRFWKTLEKQWVWNQSIYVPWEKCRNRGFAKITEIFTVSPWYFQWGGPVGYLFLNNACWNPEGHSFPTVYGMSMDTSK